MSLKNRFLLFLAAVPVIAAITLGSAFTVISGFSLPVRSGFLIIFLLIYAAFSALPYLFPERGWKSVLAGVLIVSLGLAILYFSGIRASAMLSWKIIISTYADTFPGLTRFIPKYLIFMRDRSEFLFIFLGMILSQLTAAVIFRKLPIYLPAILSVPMLTICLIAKDTIPDAFPLALLSAAYIFLIITRSGKRNFVLNPGVQLFLMVPILLFVLLIGVATHPKDYEKPDWTGAVQRRFQEFTDLIPGPGIGSHKGTLGSQSWNDDPLVSDLASSGPTKKTGSHVMDVQAEKTGVYYLKGVAYTNYTGTSWTNPENREENTVVDWLPDEDIWIAKDFINHEVITVRTDFVSNTVYSIPSLTTLPGSSRGDLDLRLTNPRGIKQYSISFTEDPIHYHFMYNAYVHQNYLSLPADTEAFLDQYSSPSFRTLKEELNVPENAEEGNEIIYNAEEEEERVKKIVNFVRNSAVYDLKAARMPYGEDFVCWFLENCSRGYCIHFASTAAVLLRYFGIPARFVTGFVAKTKPGEWVPVTEDNAHAWVEYFSKEEKWVRVDPTPAGSGNIVASISEDAEEFSRPDLPSRTPSSDAPSRETRSEAESVPGYIPGTTPGEKGISIHIPPAVLIVLGVLLLLTAIEVFGRLRIKKKLTKGKRNEIVVFMYRRIRRLSRLTRRGIPKEAEDLALKARFSGHVLSKEELELMRNHYNFLMVSLRYEKPFLKALLYRLIFLV